LEHIKGIRAEREKKLPTKAETKKLARAIEQLSQEEIEGLRVILQEVRAREAEGAQDLSQ
jgi:uncharacterized membrane protein